MTYEDWCKNSSKILKQAEEWNAWRKEAQHKLLTEIGPRIAKLGKRAYMGYGFHYSKEQTFGELVKSLALPWQPSANHCDKVKDQMCSNMTTRVIYEVLIEEIEEAEESLKKKKKTS